MTRYNVLRVAAVGCSIAMLTVYVYSQSQQQQRIMPGSKSGRVYTRDEATTKPDLHFEPATTAPTLLFPGSKSAAVSTNDWIGGTITVTTQPASQPATQP
jgi:alpha-beta hydrolase superfamily lysophospholipase